MLGEAVVEQINNFQTQGCFLPYTTWLSAEKSREREGSESNGRGSKFDKLSIKEGDLHEKTGDVLHLGFLDAGATAH